MELLLDLADLSLIRSVSRDVPSHVVQVLWGDPLEANYRQHQHAAGGGTRLSAFKGLNGNTATERIVMSLPFHPFDNACKRRQTIPARMRMTTQRIKRSTNALETTRTNGSFRATSCDFLAPHAGWPRGDPTWIVRRFYFSRSVLNALPQAITWSSMALTDCSCWEAGLKTL